MQGREPNNSSTKELRMQAHPRDPFPVVGEGSDLARLGGHGVLPGGQVGSKSPAFSASWSPVT